MHIDHIDNILPSAKPSATTNVYRAEQENKIINNNRDLIYQYIRTYPGTHLRKISKHLSLGMGNIQYHLDTLEKIGIVKSRKISIYKVYYDVGVQEGRHESVLAILQHETLRSILLYLIENPGASQLEIATHVGCSAPTVAWHMSLLMKIELVYNHKQGKFMKYYIKGNLKEITDLIKSYHPTIWNKLSSRLADLFLDLPARNSEDEDNEDD